LIRELKKKIYRIEREKQYKVLLYKEKTNRKRNAKKCQNKIEREKEKKKMSIYKE